jgi:hypothetical protein
MAHSWCGGGNTTGCGTNDSGQPIYCPERGVIRAEMAVFLTRTLGQDKQTPLATPTFADVPADYWAYTQIEAFVKLGITTGCGEDELGRHIFCPERGVTRAEMAAFMVRAKGQTPLIPATPTFADVSASYWAFRQIERFLSLGVTTGCDEDESDNRIYSVSHAPRWRSSSSGRIRSRWRVCQSNDRKRVRAGHHQMPGPVVIYTPVSIRCAMP